MNLCLQTSLGIKSWGMSWLLLKEAPAGSCATRWERMVMARDQRELQPRPWAAVTSVHVLPRPGITVQGVLTVLKEVGHGLI